MTLKEDTKKEVHYKMNLFFYILSKTNLYSGLKGLKDLKFKRFKEFPARFIEPFVSFENFVFLSPSAIMLCHTESTESTEI